MFTFLTISFCQLFYFANGHLFARTVQTFVENIANGFLLTRTLYTEILKHPLKREVFVNKLLTELTMQTPVFLRYGQVHITLPLDSIDSLKNVSGPWTGNPDKYTVPLPEKVKQQYVFKQNSSRSDPIAKKLSLVKSQHNIYGIFQNPSTPLVHPSWFLLYLSVWELQCTALASTPSA